MYAMKKKLRRSLLITLALLFLIESWLWEKTGALVARLVEKLPFAEIKQWITERIEHLSPLYTLGIFIIPFFLLLPFKLFALWLFAKGFVFSGILCVLGAKLMGLGVVSFLFNLCKPKLLQLKSVAWIYHQCLHWKERALQLVRPYTRYIKRILASMTSGGKLSKRFFKLRSRMHHSRKEL